MVGAPIEGRVLRLFAELLDYPRTELTGVAGDCAALVAARSTEAAGVLHEFEAFAANTPLPRLEEIYSSVFELDATCHPYIGYHMFGETYKRSAFMLGLKERYRPYAIECGVELPDHLAVMLRFLAVNADLTETEEIISQALHPALRKMLKSKDEEPPDPDIPRAPAKGDEYRHVLQALSWVLQTMAPDGEPPTEDLAAGNLTTMTAGQPGGMDHA